MVQYPFDVYTNLVVVVRVVVVRVVVVVVVPSVIPRSLSASVHFEVFDDDCVRRTKSESPLTLADPPP
jgi:hypothetical protein